MLYFIAIPLTAFFARLYLYLYTLLNARRNTSTLWPRVNQWKSELLTSAETMSDEVIDELIASDRLDMNRLIQEKLKNDDKIRDDLEQREADLPNRAAKAAVRAAAAYKLNKK